MVMAVMYALPLWWVRTWRIELRAGRALTEPAQAEPTRVFRLRARRLRRVRRRRQLVAYQLKGGVNSTRPRRKIRLAATRFVGASSRRLRRRRRQAPAPAASSAKCAVPRPQILTRIAVIEHSTRAASALLRLLPPPPPPPPPPLPCPQRALWPRGQSAAASCQSPAGPLHRTKVSFTLFSLRKWSAWMPHGQLGCHNNQYNQMVRCDT